MDAGLLTLALGLVCVGLIVAGAVVAVVLVVVRKSQRDGLLDAWERASPQERQALLDRINESGRS